MRTARSRFVVLAALAVVCVAGSAGVSAQAPLDKAWATLRSGLAATGKDERAAAVRVLGLLGGNPTASAAALAALKDKEPDVRATAADALGRMNATGAVAAIQQVASTDTDVAVVMACARSLIALGQPLGYSVYYAVLTGERKTGGDLLDEQKKMLNDPKRMAQFGFEQGIGFIPFGGVTMGAVKALTKDDASPVRAAAARILAKDPDTKTRDALVAAVSDKSWIVRAAALDALALRGDPSVLSKIQAALGDEKDFVRLTGAATVVHLHDVQRRAK